MMSWIRVGLPLALLSLCSPSAFGQQPDQLCMTRTYWKSLLRGYENLNPTFTTACRSEYVPDLNQPSIVRPGRNETVVAAQALLSAFLNLFSYPGNPLPTGPRRKFMNILLEILSQLRSCVNSQNSDYVSRSNIRQRFQKLHDFINQKGNSNCAWEIVHHEGRTIFYDVII